eukprot:scaffold9984_cov148-Skeletonema_dohrnii-CCMP3373.AAC.1
MRTIHTTVVEATDMMCCASCGKSEVDEIKLKKCTACNSARYCSVTCQRNHRPKHKKACKRRAAELRDEILFRQPESTHLGDCPICFLPLSIVSNKSTLMSCCSKLICKGCEYANLLREREEHVKHTCPFCRHPNPKNMEEFKKNAMKRAAANDPIALQQVGSDRYREGDYESGIKYLTKAAELGDAEAHHTLMSLYGKGQVVEKDEKKEWYHLEEAAIAGHPLARYKLGCREVLNERPERAVKHWIIAANLGCDKSTRMLKQFYSSGLVSKEEFAAALRAHQAAVDATKSPQREAAAKATAAGKTN